MRAFFVALVAGTALVLFGHVAHSQKQDEPPQQVKQMKLTEKQIQSFIAAQKQLAPLAGKLEADQPDPGLEKQVEEIAKSNGFSSVEELDDVNANIALILAGLDPKNGQFLEPPELIKRDIEELKQDKQMPQKQKDEALADMQEALKTATPLQFKQNIELVKKFQKDLEGLQQEGSKEPTTK